MQYVKVAFKKEGKGLFTYKPDKLYEANKWDPTASDPREFGGFNFSTPEKILRWIFRGDTLYDVEIPEGAEVQEIESASAPHGIFRSNKIVLRNPRPITDDVAYELYMHSDLPWKSYIQSACGCAIRGHWNTAFNILDNNITNENRDEAIQIIKDWCHPGGEVSDRLIEIVQNVKEYPLERCCCNCGFAVSDDSTLFMRCSKTSNLIPHSIWNDNLRERDCPYPEDEDNSPVEEIIESEG